MKQFIRTLIVLFALAEGIAWTAFTAGVWQWGKSGAGAGDGGGGAGSGGAALFGFLLIGAIWFLPVSPYLCMVAASLNIFTGKSLRIANIYSLIVLSIMTLIFAVTFQQRLEFMALGNILLGGLWLSALRGMTSVQSEPTQPL